MRNQHRCVITGASSGIGRAVAVALARRGARLVLVGRDAARLGETVLCVRDGGAPDALSVEVDLTAETAAGGIEAVVRERFGGLDLLVHAAGICLFGGVEAGRVEDLDAQFAVNVRAPFQLTQCLLPLLIESRGDVVFVNSTATVFPRGEMAQYAASKHALRGIADCLRQEVNSRGVRVLSVFSGRAATALQETIHGWEGRDYRPHVLLQPEDVAEVIVRALELPRTAETTDVWVRPMQKG